MIIQSLKKQTHTIFLRDLYSSSKLTTVTKKPELLLSTKRGNRVLNLLCYSQWFQNNSEGSSKSIQTKQAEKYNFQDLGKVRQNLTVEVMTSY